MVVTLQKPLLVNCKIPANNFDETVVILKATWILLYVEFIRYLCFSATLQLHKQNFPSKFDALEQGVNKKWALQHPHFDK